MEWIWAPWRMEYVGGGGAEAWCIFCLAAEGKKDYVLASTGTVVVLLNKYPYTTGHLMVAPVRHVADLESLTNDELTDLILTMRHAECALRREYRPQGMNMGFNIGHCAGAGIPGHVHAHVVPRWVGDTNFMPVVGQTRVIPETLDRTFERLQPYFRGCS